MVEYVVVGAPTLGSDLDIYFLYIWLSRSGLVPPKQIVLSTHIRAVSSVQSSETHGGEISIVVVVHIPGVRGPRAR